MVDFVFTALPLLAIALSVMGLAAVGYQRNVMTDIAIESARFAALADQTANSACSVAENGVKQMLAIGLKTSVACSEQSTAAGRLISVVVQGQVPNLGLLPAISVIKAEGHAYAEVQ